MVVTGHIAVANIRVIYRMHTVKIQSISMYISLFNNIFNAFKVQPSFTAIVAKL